MNSCIQAPSSHRPPLPSLLPLLLPLLLALSWSLTLLTLPSAHAYDVEGDGGPTNQTPPSLTVPARTTPTAAKTQAPRFLPGTYLPFQSLQTWHCNYAWLFYPNGTAHKPPGPFSWGSTAATSRFQPGPCLLVSGVHVVQTFRKTLLVIDRTDGNNSYLYFWPGNMAQALELTLAPLSPIQPRRQGFQRPIHHRTNTFCSTGATDSWGNVLTIGGSPTNNGGYSDQGLYSIRQFIPCSNFTCDTEVVGSLASKRWYPTAQLLGDGRMIIVGGSTAAVYLSYPGQNNPTVEYYFQGKTQGTFFVKFLSDTAPYNLYPFVHLLPSGRAFIFAGQQYILFDTATSMEVPGNYPPLKLYDMLGFPIYRNYPVDGTSVLFPLTRANSYLAEIMICGGSSSRAAPEDRSKANVSVVADSNCWRISPEAPQPIWTQEKMCKDYPRCTLAAPRVMGDAVLLPDGGVLIINGAERGYASIPVAASAPALQPLLYNTQAHKWYTVPLAPSRIPRGYHSNALLLHDATVFLSGSNPHSPSNLAAPVFPSEFRTEVFWPPYLYRGARPALRFAPPSVRINSRFTVQLQVFQRSLLRLDSRLEAVLVYSGFSTHGHRHGMRNVNLDLITWTAGGGVVNATFLAPPYLHICPPTFYWLFVLDNGVPCQEALPVRIVP